jgi:two-component system NtrC family response regulator
MRTLIIVEDDPGLREQMKWALCESFGIAEADSLPSTLEAFRGRCADGEPPPLVCLDMGLEGRHDRGLDVIDALIAADRSCKVVAVTASTDEALGREAIRRGAFDYLNKPLDPGALRLLLDRATRLGELEAEPSWSPAPAPSDGQAPGPAAAASREGGRAEWVMLGESEPMRRIFSVMRRLAPTDVSVLVTGEPGTGKEACARALHRHSPRRGQAFVILSCAAAPEARLEADLFGYVRGAFEGATSDRMGLLESAHRGTLFLDGIGDMPAAIQAKLLRSLQDQRIQRLGDTRMRPLDVRVIASARPPVDGNASPRPELQYRLGEFEIALPPLRERGRDALIIASALVERNRLRFAQPRLRLSSRAEKLILSHGWPGNVSELEERVNHASVACRNQVIEDQDLQVGAASAGNLNYREARRLFERNLLLSALKRTNGNVSLAARTMGVTRPTFYDMMKKSGVSLRLEPKMEPKI